MHEEPQRTPGVGMTEVQCMQMLDEMRIAQVTKPDGGKMTLTVSIDGGAESVSVTEFKGRSVQAIADLDDRKKEIEENAFASTMEGELPTGPNRSLQVKYLKRDDQLTPEEEEEKRRLLRDVNKELGHHRSIIGLMNYLQVHYKELAAKLARRELPLEIALPRIAGTKARWTKGIKTAALFCLKESRKEANTGKTQLDLCKEFLAHYTIEGEDDYSPEQLFRNMQQIVQLDRNE
jgi:hypothetical protein